MKNEKHIALAAQIVENSWNTNGPIAYPDLDKLRKNIAAALSQVESDALASKVVGQLLGEDIRLAIDKAFKENAEANGDGLGIKDRVWFAVQDLLSSQLTLAPNEQVIGVPKREDIQNQIEDFKWNYEPGEGQYEYKQGAEDIIEWLFARMSDEKTAPNEPEVKAQSTKEEREIAHDLVEAWRCDWIDRKDNEYNLRIMRVDANMEASLARKITQALVDARAALSGANAACGEFESWFIDVASQKAKDIVNRIGNIANRPDLKETQLTQVREILELVMRAGQKSKAATLKLPADIKVLDKRIELSKKHGEQSEGATFDFYVWYLDAVMSMNEGDGE